jgi:hypothetical protein
MKKILVYVIGLIAILWVSIFVTDKKVLVWESLNTEEVEQCTITHAQLVEGWETQVKQWRDTTDCVDTTLIEKSTGKETIQCIRTVVPYWVNHPPVNNCRYWWKCKYFNGRRIIDKMFQQSEYDSCPNLL